MESIRKNPEKYRQLVRHNESTTVNYLIPEFNLLWSYGQPYSQKQYQQHNQSKMYFIEDYVAMVSDDGEKLMETLVRELGDELINDYAVSKSPQTSLPVIFRAKGY